MASRINESLVVARTGRTFHDWFTIIEGFEGFRKGHKAIAKHLAEDHGMSLWYAQTITVQYERDRVGGESDEAERSRTLSIQRTIGVAISRAFEAWTHQNRLAAWNHPDALVDARVGGRIMDGDFLCGEILDLESPKLLRFSFENPRFRPGSSIDVEFFVKGGLRTLVRLTHTGLGCKSEADEAKAYWNAALDSLRAYLETGAGISRADWGRDAD
jgi:uncharacterized protein YndB with AHSA1/START domain